MRSISVYMFLVFVFLKNGFSIYAQKSQKELEAERLEIQKEINNIQKLLFASKSESKNLLNQVQNLNLKIKAQNKLINIVDKEVSVISIHIKSNQSKIDKLQVDLGELKTDYAKLIYSSYKSRSLQSRLMFLLSSQNFYQAFKRIAYIEQYTKYRKIQGEKIQEKKKEIELLLEDLKSQKIQKEILVEENQEAKFKIIDQKQYFEKLAQDLRKKEKEYTNLIQKKQEQERNIDLEIEKRIKEAIAETNSKSIENNKEFSLTAQGKLLAGKFTDNKGRMPWPVASSGVVIRRFGEQNHPTMPGIKIKSNGVYIATEKKSKARSIFTGKVLAVQLLTAGKKAVLIQHGNFVTVYKNLEEVYVVKGDLVNAKQDIGVVYTDKITNETVLGFAISKNLKYENPKNWIYKM